MTRRFTRAAAITALAAIALGSLGGCEGIAFLSALGGEKVKAAYPLADRPTLVLVEDPNQRLGNPALTSVIGANASHLLLSEEVLAKANRVPQKAIGELQVRLGTDYGKTPIDQIGRLLEAEQVIHVVVQSVSLETAPGVYRPTAVVDVKLIDAAEGKRLYPGTSQFADPAVPAMGHPIKVETTVRTAGTGGRGVRAVLARELAEEVGQSVARLFFDHKRPEPGSALK